MSNRTSTVHPEYRQGCIDTAAALAADLDGRADTIEAQAEAMPPNTAARSGLRARAIEVRAIALRIRTVAAI